jgi:hypothetical protein
MTLKMNFLTAHSISGGIRNEWKRQAFQCEKLADDFAVFTEWRLTTHTKNQNNIQWKN